MKQLEIIHLRASGGQIESLGGRIRASILADEVPAEVVTVYRRNGLETDLAVHIRRSEAAGRPGPSGLGLRLASALRAYGIVEHSLWEELS